MCVDGKDVEIQPSWVDVKQEMKKVHGRNYTPAVIEPSFGIGRILYCLFEHSYYTREGDERRAVFRFTPLVAPIKTTVFPLMAKADLVNKAEEISASLTRAGLSNAIDTTGVSIGKRYARTDEIGVPFAVTVDFETLSEGTATLRDRDSTAQVRVPAAELPEVLRKMTDMEMTWKEISEKYPAQAPAGEED